MHWSLSYVTSGGHWADFRERTDANRYENEYMFSLPKNDSSNTTSPQAYNQEKKIKETDKQMCSVLEHKKYKKILLHFYFKWAMFWKRNLLVLTCTVSSQDGEADFDIENWPEAGNCRFVECNICSLSSMALKYFKEGGPGWLSRLGVRRPTRGFGSGRDLRILRSSPKLDFVLGVEPA